MGINGADNNQPKSIEDYKKLADSIKNEKNTETVKNEVSIFINDATYEADKALADTVITKTEAKSLSTWLSVASTIKNRISENPIMKETVAKLQKLREVLFDLIDMAEKEEYEPQESDSTTFEQKYPIIDKKADALLEKARAEQQQRNASAKAHAINPNYVEDDRTLSTFDLDEIIELYQDYVNDGNGYGKKIFKPEKAQQLIRWTEQQFASYQINKEDYDYIMNKVKPNKKQPVTDYKAKTNSSPYIAPTQQQTEKYWAGKKSAGYSHDLVKELTDLGYSRKKAEEIAKNGN